MTHPLRARIEAAAWWRVHLRQRCRGIRQGAPQRLLTATIQAEVARYYGLSVEEMNSHRNAVRIARPRMIAMYLAKRLTQLSLPEIGRRAGGRDHSTVINAVRRIGMLIETDPDLRRDVEALTAIVVAHV